MIRSLILGTILAVLITATLAAGIVWVALATWHPTHPADPAEQRFLQWETCTLNNQPHCGPQPVP